MWSSGHKLAAAASFSLFLFLFLATSDALLPDNDVTKSLEEAVQEDQFILSLKHIKPKKRIRSGIETVLEVDFPGSQHKLQLQLDRRSRRVIVETLEDGRPRTQHFFVEKLTEASAVHNLLIVFDQRKPGAGATLYFDCESQGKITSHMTLKEMFNSMRNPHIQAYRERKYEVQVESDFGIGEMLDRNNCPNSIVDDMINDQQFAGNDLTTQIRGDIPIIHDCDDNLLVKAINDLIQIVKQLKEEVNYQRAETRRLREYLEKCDVCKPVSAAQVRSTCSNTPCFPGVECRDTAEGPRCGRCPHGFVGDGRSCKPGITCSENPCHPGVRCYDTVEGFQCGSCPAGMTGDGRRCAPRSGCDNRPCSSGVQCVNSPDPPYYRCGACPEGFTGNGTNCHDLDECDLAEPCDTRVKCTNLVPGFRCEACPPGFTGSPGLEGVGLEFAHRYRQRCYDIDECADGRNGGCAHNSVCTNTEGSFHCGSCKMGYIGNQTSGCRNQPGLCPDGTQCDSNAECVRASYHSYRCK